MSNVDPVVVAKRLVSDEGRWGFHGATTLSDDEIAAIVGVVLAAATVIDTVPSSESTWNAASVTVYDPHDGLVVRHAQALNALAAALRGEGE